MNELRWYFPKNLEEAENLLSESGVVPCGGGTFLRKSGIRNIEGLICLKNLPLSYFRQTLEHFELGANMTFADVLYELQSNDPDSILLKSLCSAASTPLRNIITIGGSVAAFPMWSSIMGPLIALDAEVHIVGTQKGFFSIVDYCARRELHKGTMITGIRFKREHWKSYFYRFVRTHFDYSAFNITMLIKTDGSIVQDVRLVIVGTKQRYTRFHDLEKTLISQGLKEIDPTYIARSLEMQFADKKMGSAEFVENTAKVEVERGMRTLLKG